MRARQAIEAGLLLASLLGSSCKGDGRPTEGAPTGAAPAPAAKPSQAVADPASDACAFFTKEIAAEVLGTDVEGAHREELLSRPGEADNCEWHAVGDPKTTVSASFTKHAYSCDTFVASMKGEFEDVQEVAIGGKPGAILHMKLLDQIGVCAPVYTVIVGGKVSDDKLKAGAEKLIARLPQ